MGCFSRASVKGWSGSPARGMHRVGLAGTSWAGMFCGLMHCPFCQSEKEALKVIDTRGADSGKSIRRRRECEECGKRFTTYERVEDPVRLTVVKRDGERVPWDRDKILRGLERACYKRAVPELELLRIVDEIEEEARKEFDREVQSSRIGEAVIERLRRLDQVAYVRFASVYKKFQTLEDLVSEAQAVLDARRFEDPTQGKLFLDDAKPRPAEKKRRPARSRGGESNPGKPADVEASEGDRRA
jgi:transcriptional repressor NrdR